MGAKFLSKIQMGRESTPGTAVPATFIWGGCGILKDEREVKFVDGCVGNLGGDLRSYTPKLAATLELEETEASFERLPHLFEMGISAATPSHDGSGGYVYVYNAPTTNAPTPKSYTVEGGDNVQAEEMEYAILDELTISGKAGDALMMSATLFGRQLQNTTFTSALPAVDTEVILFQRGKLYIDDSGGTIGSTQMTGVLLSMEYKYKSGLAPRYTADGELYFDHASIAQPEIELSLTLEHTTGADAERAKWRAETPRLIRLAFEGSAISGGSTYTHKTLIIDLAGKWTEMPNLDDEDGDTILTGKFVPRYSETDSLYARHTIVNNLSSL